MRTYRLVAACALILLTTVASPGQTNPPTTAPATGPTDDTTVGRAKTGSMAGHFMRHHEQYVARTKQGNIDVVFLGDSITQLWSSAPDVWKTHYEPLKAVNYGIMGDVIQHVLWRVEHGELDGISPKVVVLLVGTNNSKRHNAEPIFAGIEHLVAVIHSKCPATKVLVLSIFPRIKADDVPVQMQNIKTVDAELPKLDDGRLTRVLNINDKFYDAQGNFRQDLFKDGLHPNPAGYKVWADAMQPLLDEMLKP